MKTVVLIPYQESTDHSKDTMDGEPSVLKSTSRTLLQQRKDRLLPRVNHKKVFNFGDLQPAPQDVQLPKQFD